MRGESSMILYCLNFFSFDFFNLHVSLIIWEGVLLWKHELSIWQGSEVILRAINSLIYRERCVRDEKREGKENQLEGFLGGD